MTHQPTTVLRTDAPATPTQKPKSPAREAARDLHEQFLVQMLRQSGLAEALTGRGASGEAAALADFAFGTIAADLAEAQPSLTEKLYAALRREEKA